jgi:putative ABC transport system permease protein
MFLVKTAFKNILRHKRRTILNIIAFVVNIFCIIFFTAFYRGVVEDGYKYRIDYLLGHIQIHNPEYEKAKEKFPLDITVKNPDNIIADLENHPDITGIAKRVEFSVSVSNGTDRMNCFGIGIQPEREVNIGVLKDKMVDGDYLEKNDEGVLIGKRLADLLNVKVGDVIYLYFYTAYDQPNVVDTTIKGLFNYKFGGLDKYAVYCSYDFIKPFLNMPEGASKIMIRLKNRNMIPKMMAFLEEYKQKNNLELQINDWKYYSQSVIEELEAGKARLSIFYFVLVLIALFSIINTMSTAVFERKKEIGTIRAIGLLKRQTLRLTLYESTIISLIGVAIAWILGFILTFYLSKNGIQLYEFTQSDSFSSPMPEKMYAVQGISEYILTLFLGVGAGILGGLSPALRITKLKIVDALRN